MCGFTGVAWQDPAAAIDADVLGRMTEVLGHRGPDDQQLWFSQGTAGGPAAALGHRRLSIIDVDNSRQPLANEDGSVVVAFNGEIYNYRELRDSLASRGHHLRTEGDTETIVHLYEEYGADCVEHLRGMFAFALWDERQQRLLLARDRMGQKPLYYRIESDRITFASELKSLLHVPGAPRELDPAVVDLYLTYQYVPHPHCILKGYAQLPPGHLAIWSAEGLSTRAYWQPPFAEAPEQLDARDWVAELRETLTDAVRLRMRSDVPLGAFLSGGVDSTLIVGLMAGLSERPVQTFSIGFPEERFDERSFAREAADLHSTEHTELVVEPSALDILPKLIWHYDEPFSDSSAIPTMLLSELARRDVTVSLSGDGGDELFFGYDRYLAVRLAERFDRIPAPLRKLLGIGSRIPASVRQRSFLRRLKRFLSSISEPPRQRYLNWVSIFAAAQRAELYEPAFARQFAGQDAAAFLFGAYDAAGSHHDFVSQTAFADTITYLPCDILTKVDRASMSCGLEARSPLLDHHVVELAVRMPRELKQSDRAGKVILKSTFADLLPESISRRPKMGFGVPIDIWFRGELKELLHDVLLDSHATHRGWFRPAVVRQLVEEHTSGRADHAYRLWALLVLELWARKFLEGVVPTAP